MNSALSGSFWSPGGSLTRAKLEEFSWNVSLHPAVSAPAFVSSLVAQVKAPHWFVLVLGLCEVIFNILVLFFNSPEFCWFISTKLTISANYRSHFVSFRHNHCINTLISTFCLSDQTWHSFELKRWVDLVWHSSSCFLTELIIWADWPASSVITV